MTTLSRQRGRGRQIQDPTEWVQLGWGDPRPPDALPGDIMMLGGIEKESAELAWADWGRGAPEHLRDGSLAGRGRLPAAVVSRRAQPAVPGRAPRPELTPCPPPTADLVAGPRVDLRQRQALCVHPGPLRLQPVLLPMVRHACSQVHLLGRCHGHRRQLALPLTFTFLGLFPSCRQAAL